MIVESPYLYYTSSEGILQDSNTFVIIGHRKNEDIENIY